MNRFGTLLGIVLASGLPSATSALEPGGTQDLDTLRTVARNYLATRHAANAADVRIDVAPPDPRLRLASCTVPLKAALAPGARDVGNVLVDVRCTGTAPWHLFIQAKVQRLARVLVAARPLARGENVTAADVVVETRDLAGLTNAFFSGFQAVDGKRVKRPIGSGVVLTPALVEAIPVIRRGDTVTIVAPGKGIEVRVTGEALTDGAPGDTIRVRNTSTRRIVDATVVSQGTVKVLI